MNHLILLIQYYFIIDPYASARLFMRYHVLLDLLVHVDYRFVRETMAYLFTPGDQFLKLDTKVHGAFVEYCTLINFNELLISQIIRPDDEVIYAEKKKLSQNKQLKSFLNALTENLREEKAPLKKFNIFESIYNNLILGKLMKASVVQPEQINYGLPNIDMLPPTMIGQINKRKASLLGFSSDIIKLNSKLFENEIMPGNDPHSLKASAKEKSKHPKTNDSLKRLQSFQGNLNPNQPVKRNTKAILRKSLTKVITALALGKKPHKIIKEVNADINQIPGEIYPEKVETYNIAVLENKRIFKENFEINLKKERHITCLLEFLYSVIAIPLKQHENLEMAKFLQQPISDITTIKELFFTKADLYCQLLTSFVIRLEYKAINNLDMTSIFTSGKLLCLFLKHL